MPLSSSPPNGCALLLPSINMAIVPNASYSHWIRLTGWTTIIDVMIVHTIPFHHFYFNDISVLRCLINVVIVIKVVYLPLSHASMLPWM
jgi:hypothetical protein